MHDKQATRQQTRLAGNLASLMQLQTEVVTKGTAWAEGLTMSRRSRESRAGQTLTTHLIH